MAKYLDETGLSALWTKIKALITSTASGKVDKVSGKQLSTNDYTTAEKTKLAGVELGAEINQNAFSHVLVNGTTLSADSDTDVLTFAAGSNVTLTPDVSTDKITISSTNTTYNPATGAANGLMSAADKAKLDGVSAGANNYTHPVTHPATIIVEDVSHRFTTDSEKVTWNAKASTAVATATANGLMSANDKKSLDNYGRELTYKVGFTIGGGNSEPERLDDVSSLYDYTLGCVTINGTEEYGSLFGYQISEVEGKQIFYTRDKEFVRTTTSSDKTAWQDVTPATQGSLSKYALKSDIVGMYKFKGTVANATKLPTSGQVTGDVYNITSASAYGAAGANVAWDGTKWDSLGEIFSIASLTAAEVNAICV